MMCKMRRRKPEPTLLTIQGIFNLTHNIGIVWEELAFDDTAGKLIEAELNVIAVTEIRTDVYWVAYPMH